MALASPSIHMIVTKFMFLHARLLLCSSIVLLALFSGQQCLHFGVLCALYLLAIKCLMVGGT